MVTIANEVCASQYCEDAELEIIDGKGISVNEEVITEGSKVVEDITNQELYYAEAATASMEVGEISYDKIHNEDLIIKEHIAQAPACSRHVDITDSVAVLDAAVLKWSDGNHVEQYDLLCDLAIEEVLGAHDRTYVNSTVQIHPNDSGQLILEQNGIMLRRTNEGDAEERLMIREFNRDCNLDLQKDAVTFYGDNMGADDLGAFLLHDVLQMALPGNLLLDQVAPGIHAMIYQDNAGMLSLYGYADTSMQTECASISFIAAERNNATLTCIDGSLCGDDAGLLSGCLAYNTVALT